LLFLDMYRGLAMIGIILDNQGSERKTYWILRESEWDGLTPADCAFPAFLFIVGSVIFISL
ncbi:hypothetical protein ABTD62_21280, partial [Acinetobacter baumannii]